uniref:Uncharacterized protein n=1 Tax=Ditylenchus dipsaci TaxID=166011 RepID=A0A915EFA6_9BILA
MFSYKEKFLPFNVNAHLDDNNQRLIYNFSCIFFIIIYSMNLYLQTTTFLFIISTFIQTAICLNCKCTQSSFKTPCEDGICQASACLMLDHPLSGRHYACSTSKLKEGECMEKMTKSGSTVVKGFPAFGLRFKYA